MEPTPEDNARLVRKLQIGVIIFHAFLVAATLYFMRGNPNAIYVAGFLVLITIPELFILQKMMGKPE